MKAYTDLEQSKRLSEILPIESADMKYPYFGDGQYGTTALFGEPIEFSGDKDVPCWSLAALLNILSNRAYSIDEDANVFLSSYKTVEWDLSISNSDIEPVSECNDPIDACVEMILKLNEQKLIDIYNMNYEKKYKDVLEKAKIWQSHLNEIGDRDYADELNYIFPDLVEKVDDEEIRKNLIKAFGTVGKRNWGGLVVRDILTWLEKQRKEDQPKKYSFGRITLADFRGGDGSYKINLEDLTKEQVEKIEAIINESSSKDLRIRGCVGTILTDAGEQRFSDFGVTLKDCLEWINDRSPSIPITSDILKKNGFVESSLKDYWKIIIGDVLIELRVPENNMAVWFDWKKDDDGTYASYLFPSPKYVDELRTILKLCGIDKNIVP